jgi:hypothetical protein
VSGFWDERFGVGVVFPLGVLWVGRGGNGSVCYLVILIAVREDVCLGAATRCCCRGGGSAGCRESSHFCECD